MTITTFTQRVPNLNTNGITGPIQQRFEMFHKQNPGVYDLIVEIAADLKNRGFKRCGMKFIFERIRWLYALQTKSTDDFKLNNDYTAYYARLVMYRQRALEGFFRLREQRIDYDPAMTP